MGVPETIPLGLSLASASTTAEMPRSPILVSSEGYFDSVVFAEEYIVGLYVSMYHILRLKIDESQNRLPADGPDKHLGYGGLRHLVSSEELL